MNVPAYNQNKFESIRPNFVSRGFELTIFASIMNKNANIRKPKNRRDLNPKTSLILAIFIR